MARIYCHTLEDLPKEPHYAILKATSVFVREDNWGNDDYERYLEYLAFDNEEEWKKEISDRTLKGDTNFTAIFVKVPIVKATVSVELDVKF